MAGHTNRRNSFQNQPPISHKHRQLATVPAEGANVKRQTQYKTMRAPLAVRYET